MTTVKSKAINSHALEDLIKKHTFHIKCPKCGFEVEFTSNQIGSNITCSSCQSVIELKDNNFGNNLKDSQKSLNNLFK